MSDLSHILSFGIATCAAAVLHTEYNIKKCGYDSVGRPTAWGMGMVGVALSGILVYGLSGGT